VVLEVKDPDDIISQKTQKVVVNSILSVDFNASPRVITRDQKITFNAVSPEAEFFEWDFGDGEKFG
jgi:PKD repeat protein